MPAVSVIVPVYGVELYIEDCLRSIAAQTFSDFELILVDDGCKDRSIEIAEAYLQTTQLSWRVLHQENAGLGPARESGILSASGEYVVCIDSDDTVAPCFLQALYDAAHRTQSPMAFSLFRMVSLGEQVAYVSEVTPFQTISREEMLHRFLCRTLTPVIPAILIRRSFFISQNIRTSPDCRFSEDLYVMWQLFSKAETVTYTASPLYHYLQRPNSIMTASSAERILTGYRAIAALTEESSFAPDFPERGYILSRWVLGALKSTARIADFDTFLWTAGQMEYRRHMKALRRFPEGKARLLAGLLSFSPTLYYKLFHRRH